MSGLGDIKCFNCNRFGHYANECKQKRSPRFPFGRGRNRNLGYARSSAGGFQDYDERNEFIQMLMEKEKKKTLEEKEEKLKKQFSEIIKGEIDQLKRNLKVSEPKPEQEKNPTNEVLYEMKNMMKTQTLILNKLIKNQEFERKTSRKKRRTKKRGESESDVDEEENREEMDEEDPVLSEKHDDDSDYYDEKPTHDELLNINIPVYVTKATLEEKGEAYNAFVDKIIRKLNYHWGIGFKNSVKDEKLKELCVDRGISLRLNNGKTANKKMKVKLLAIHAVNQAIQKL